MCHNSVGSVLKFDYLIVMSVYFNSVNLAFLLDRSVVTVVSFR
jgi:hypothetical protein